MNNADFTSKIIAEICNYAVENGMEPDDTLEEMALTILELLDVSTFNGWKPQDAPDAK